MKDFAFRIGIRFLLAAGAGLGGGRAMAATVSGTVAEPPQYRLLEGAHVYLTDGNSPIDSQLTDTAGAFLFADVQGCGSDCFLWVRKDGYWDYRTESFGLGADGNKTVEVALERIHSLTVRVVKAEDTARFPAGAQAVLYSDAAGEAPRCARIDSAGRAQFRDLHSFTGYLLTVSAPGRKATSNMLHFHDPVSAGFSRVALDSDEAQSGKAVRGVLGDKQGNAVGGATVVLGCRTPMIAADLFGETDAEGHFRIEGVPSVCDSVMLYAGPDTLAVALPGQDTKVEWSADIPPASIAPKARAARPGAAVRIGPWRGCDLIGRKLKARGAVSAAPARSRP